MDEILDVFTREGIYIGTKTRAQCHSKKPGGYHKPVWVFIINNNNEILVQKRSKIKSILPDLWSPSSAGHVEAGEMMIDGAIRETEEELGIKTKKGDYKFCGEYILDDSWEIVQIFVAKLNFNIKDLKLQEKEVSETKWVLFEEFKNLVNSDQFIPLEESFKDLIFSIIEENMNEHRYIKNNRKEKFA